VHEWARQYPIANIGIAAGQSGLMFLDVDIKHDGHFALADRCMQYGAMPKTVEDRTGSGGSHFYFRSKGIVTGGHIAPGLEMIVRGYVVIPHSENANGRYTWVHSPNTTRIKEPWEWLLDWLEIAQAKANTNAATLPLAVIGAESRDIPRLAIEILQGKRRGDFASRSEHEYTAVLAMIGAGFDFERVLGSFARLAYGQSKFYEKLRDVGEREARRWLATCYKTACEWSSKHERQERIEARAFKRWAIAATWANATDRAVALAHGEIAIGAAATVYGGASERRLAEIAGVSNRGAHNANKRLKDAGIIRKIKPYDKANAPLIATVWALGGGGGSNGSSTLRVYPIPTPGDTAQRLGQSSAIGADVFRTVGTVGRECERGLGAGACQVYDYLRGGCGATRAQIVKDTGRSKATIKRALRSMKKWGMVARQALAGRAVWFAVDVDLQEIARKMGTAGAGDRQRKRHAEERRAWVARHKK
jgi:DNA-binding Lrp family transcriptional regulator